MGGGCVARRKGAVGGVYKVNFKTRWLLQPRLSFSGWFRPAEYYCDPWWEGASFLFTF